MPYFILFLALLFPTLGHSYPQFIGYKYNACVTCHFNSHGHGAINDYGRALWSAEIAGRLFAGNRSAEELGASSGFLGKKELPWWIRPGLKLRQLEFQNNPGTENAISQSILMQAEGNLALILDKNYRYMLVGSYGYLPPPMGSPSGAEGEWISREHYLRWQMLDELFIYVGKMDKAYGIRIVDHTAYSRALTGMNQRDQTHGLMAHWIKENYELTFHGFIGDLLDDQEPDQRHSGFSTMVEYDIASAWRIGASGLMSSNNALTRQQVALHSKQGFGNGAAILAEFGLMNNTPSNADGTLGYYLYSEATQRIRRGYHVFVTGEAFKNDFSNETQPMNLRTGFGLIAFPMARVEFRIEGKNTRQLYSTQEVPDDVWALYGQLHLSL